MSTGSPDSETILLWTPTARDAELARDILGRNGLETDVCGTLEALSEAIVEGAGAALLTEEQLTPDVTRRLATLLAAQAPWSDFPLLVLASRRQHESSSNLEPLGNVTLLDAPLRVRTLVRTARSALRARRRQYAARRAIEERDRFLAMLGHELRNPLSAISLASQAVAAGASSERALSVIRRQTAQLTRIVDDLLDVARVSSGKIELVCEPVDLSRVIEHAVEAFRERFEAGGLTLEVETSACVVRGDSARLEQIVGNLLTNALKYTPRGGRVRVHASVADGSAQIVVKDTGIGIEASMLPLIFDQFVQVESSLHRSQGGMGVGLSLVRSLVERHGGTVRAESDGRDRGSRFTVTLPAAEVRVEAAPSDAAGGEERARAGSIVVVEDNEDARTLLVAMLERMGYTVRDAADGPSGLDLVLAVAPDAAILDIGLPVIDGYLLAERIRSQVGDGVVLVALTGYGQPADRERALAAGFDRHLTKPADSKRLREVLDELMGTPPREERRC